MSAVEVSTAGGTWLVLAILLPVIAMLLAAAAGGRHVERIALATVPAGLAVAIAIASGVVESGAPLVYVLGGWSPPLGVALRADGLAAAMMLVIAVVVAAVALFARADFHVAAGAPETRAPDAFWILLLSIWSALNAVFVTGDLFTGYVALELLTFGGVPLVCLDGRAETLAAALRYLLFALVGSVFYLVGCALLYGAGGTLDMALLAARLTPSPTVVVAASLMTIGLLAKTALFPLHLWLPPAHAGAPPAASAVLSALVVKGSFFLVVRLWFAVMPAIPGGAAAQLLAALGAGAIVVGNLVALRQERLKLLVAYSTVAQIGYLFLMFPLALDASGRLLSGGALAGGILQAMAHATAKAGMFMAAGLMYAALGHDRITGLRGIARAQPLSVLTFAVGGLALMGLPPSGAYAAKELLLGAASASGQWWWGLVLQAGGVLTAAYLVLVLAHATAAPDAPLAPRQAIARGRELAALFLALTSLLLGLGGWGALLPIPGGSVSPGLSLDGLMKSLWPLLGGGVLALLLGRWDERLPRALAGAGLGALRRAALVGGGALVQLDERLRRWPVAGLSLLLLTILFGAALAAGGSP
ncbi:MAG: proton-conducting transporter membrane subunit [Deltaproteobacteria bacterium]|nr:proton-conducting transporter membrane subunit [Deltaproteobacteria bacterium]